MHKLDAQPAHWAPSGSDLVPLTPSCSRFLQASDAEPTLGERVAALQLEEQRRSAAAAGESADAADDRVAEASEAPLKAIKADSLAVLLTQVRHGGGHRCL